MNIEVGNKRTDPVTVHFDGEKYLVLCTRADCWGEGITLDEAYSSYKSKKIKKEFSYCGQSIFGDIGHIYLAYRKKIVYFFAVASFFFGVIIVINAIPTYLNTRLIEKIGNTPEDRLNFMLRAIVKFVGKSDNSANDEKKVCQSLNYLHDALRQIEDNNKCNAITSTAVENRKNTSTKQ